MGAESLSPIGVGASVLQTALGVAQAIGGNKKMKRAQAKIKPYEIPDAVYKILNATSNAMGGDAQTLNYETNQIAKSGAAAFGVASRLGADPNTLSSIFGQQLNAYAAAGQRNHAASLENFGKWTRAQELLANNEAARQKSIRDIAANEAAAAQAQMQSGLQNIAGGVNTAIATDAAARSGKLYADRTEAMKDASTMTNIVREGAGTTASVAAPVVGGIPNRSTGNPYITPLVGSDKVNKYKTVWGTNW